jgi:CHRD domain/PEP-CTERM motif
MRSLSFVALALALGVTTSSAEAAIIKFVVPLDGAQEVNGMGVPNQGDPDGSGVGTLLIDSEALTIDWEFVVNGITLPLTLAHIHNAPAGSNGPVVVDFDAQLSGLGLNDPDLAAVLANPTNFYINLHNEDFRPGALRGQLGQPVPEPAALALFGLGGLALAAARRRRSA